MIAFPGDVICCEKREEAVEVIQASALSYVTRQHSLAHSQNT